MGLEEVRKVMANQPTFPCSCGGTAKMWARTNAKFPCYVQCDDCGKATPTVKLPNVAAAIWMKGTKMKVNMAIGGDRKKVPTLHAFRTFTEDDMSRLKVGDHVYFVSRDGTARQAKVTSIKRWKTKPDVQIGLKYGLYEFAKFNKQEALDRLLVREEN